MEIALVVNAPPLEGQAPASALAFAEAALSGGHRLRRVFFYHGGVYNANRLAVPGQDEADLLSRWQRLAGEHAVELAVCVAAAQRRGMLDEGEARRAERDAHVLAPGFRIVGLGQLVEAIADADRVVTFG